MFGYSRISAPPGGPIKRIPKTFPKQHQEKKGMRKSHSEDKGCFCSYGYLIKTFIIYPLPTRFP